MTMRRNAFATTHFIPAAGTFARPSRPVFLRVGRELRPDDLGAGLFESWLGDIIYLLRFATIVASGYTRRGGQR